MRLRELDKLREELFAKSWSLLHGSGALGDSILGWPGVYLLAYPASTPNAELDGRSIDVGDVSYVGMSLSKSGIRGRLKQFMTAIECKPGHSAGKAFCRLHKERPYSTHSPRVPIYFAALAIPSCTKKSEAGPDDFRAMGHVACLELYALAYVRERTRKVPRFNTAAGGVLDEAI